MQFFLPLNTITITDSNISVSPAIAMPENPFCYFIHHEGFHHELFRLVSLVQTLSFGIPCSYSYFDTYPHFESQEANIVDLNIVQCVMPYHCTLNYTCFKRPYVRLMLELLGSMQEEYLYLPHMV